MNYNTKNRKVISNQFYSGVDILGIPIMVTHYTLQRIEKSKGRIK